MSRPGSIWSNGTCLWTLARLADSPLSRARGWLGRSAPLPQEALWLRSCTAVHMWGMRFSIDLLWLSATGEILALRKNLRPWYAAWSPITGARDTVEIARGSIERLRLAPGQVLEWREDTSPIVASQMPRERGAGAVEFLISIPLILLLILGTLQTSLLYQSRLQLEVATQEAARAGALHGGDMDAIRAGLARGLTPLYTHGQSLTDLAKGRLAAEAAAKVAKIEILSPTVEALHDFKQYGRLPLDDNTGTQATPGGNWGWGIPESHLGYRQTSLGKESGISLQDANLLKIRVTYRAPLIMPFIDRLLARFDRGNAGGGSVIGSPAGGHGAFEQQSGPVNIPDPSHPNLSTFPLTAEATFRMQTPFTHFAGLQSQSQLQAPQRGGNEEYSPPKTAETGANDLEPMPEEDSGVPDYGLDLPPAPKYDCGG
ncbi:DUF192 domain-containing protein [Candidatus Igneacidithiobacillus taiwanensis]|uniref:DUF192 domain-containing protein n=2 Tax=Candidatus Igneacidithiobacillus taiwanensis TaxID=1945924 RepID=UPI0028A18A8F|nr:DUF192 domain-containing protein [Candidatus Igneacidithiobacillus taiwanensis]